MVSFGPEVTSLWYVPIIIAFVFASYYAVVIMKPPKESKGS